MSVGAVNKQTGDRIPTAGMPAIDDALDLTSVNPVQNAVITAALALKQDKTDNALQTTDKTVVGAINEHEGDISSLMSGLTNLDNEVNGDATTYPYADVITIEDAIPANVADCTVKIEPVQDLHGYDKPWVGGAGKNKLPLVLADIKSANTGGTWNDNVYTVNNGTFTVYTDDGGNVTSIKANGTFTNVSSLYLIPSNYVVSSECKMNGCPDGGTYNSSYSLWAVYDDTTEAVDSGNGITLAVGIITQVRIRIAANYNAQNLMFYPMLRLSTEIDATFAPYSNECPITGHTEASVQRDGKNLLNIPDKDLGSSGWAIAQASPISVDAGTYTLTYDFSGTANSSVLAFYDENYVEIARGNTNSTINGRNTNKVVLPQKAYYFNMYSNAVGTYTNFMFESGEDATPYVPYAGKTYTIALGDTIYGGTVDFDSGVMTVDRAIKQVVSTDMTIASTAVIGRYLTDNNFISGEKEHGVVLCNAFKGVIDWSSDTVGECYISSNHQACFVTPYATLQEFQAWIDSNSLYICYELATPTTIQLTPQQIQLLKGTNTLTASTGQISVTVNGVSGAIGSVQEQVNELAEDVALKQNATDNNLQTTDKTIVGGINEVKSGLTNVKVKKVYFTGTSSSNGNVSITNYVSVNLNLVVGASVRDKDNTGHCLAAIPYMYTQYNYGKICGLHLIDEAGGSVANLNVEGYLFYTEYPAD